MNAWDDDDPTEGLEDYLQPLVGRPLYSVTFFRDDIVLSFDGPTITSLARATVLGRTGSARTGHSQFRNLLCDQIGKPVVSVECRERVLTLGFGDQTAIVLPLRNEDYIGAAILVARLDPSEPSFAVT